MTKKPYDRIYKGCLSCGWSGFVSVKQGGCSMAECGGLLPKKGYQTKEEYEKKEGILDKRLAEEFIEEIKDLGPQVADSTNTQEYNLDITPEDIIHKSKSGEDDNERWHDVDIELSDTHPIIDEPIGLSEPDPRPVI
jgi:hypothetical protein